jgi:hypothetical protein
VEVPVAQPVLERVKHEGVRTMLTLMHATPGDRMLQATGRCDLLCVSLCVVVSSSSPFPACSASLSLLLRSFMCHDCHNRACCTFVVSIVISGLLLLLQACRCSAT